MKQISWLSGFSATGSPRSRAYARTAPFGRSPTGKHAAERRRHAPRVVQIVDRAAAAERGLSLGLIVELHRQADDVVALLGEERRSHRRIDAARHRDYDAHLVVRPRSFSTSRGRMATVKS